MKKCLTILILLCWLINCNAQTIDLAGVWDFQIEGRKQELILLPGSMPQRLKGDDISVNTKWIGSLYDSSYFYNPYMEKYRKPGKDMKLTFFLTPDKHYVGVAWYRKTIELQPRKDKCYTLFLERPHIETTLYINGNEVGRQNSLVAPHQYDVTAYLHKGYNRIEIRIDNRLETVNVGQDSHSVTDQTQGDWNGIVGKMELREQSKMHISDMQIFPDVDNNQALVKLEIVGKSKKPVTLEIGRLDSLQFHNSIVKSFALPNDTNKVEVLVPMVDYVCWDEFHPVTYKMKAVLSDKKQEAKDERTTTFGMRKFEIRGRMFYVNNRKIQLRGTVENCDFPLTGYAPMDVESWLKVFRRCREYGLNHMRFHSYCPPEAAFVAADMVGFYLQPEGPSWPNHGVRLGNGEYIDTYLMAETQRMVKEYGNHPSFCMLSCGNEPAGRWVEWVGKFVDYWKQTDSRRVYTGASVGGGWAWQPKSQYHVKAGARGLNWGRAPQSTDDFTANITRYNGKDMPGGVDINEPFVSHETGQWCAFPNFEETVKYTGVNKARNFEVFKDILYDNGMGGMEKKFLMASGRLQALCYKYEIERTMRTPDYAGFQLLSLNDYSGQGTALVGVTDVFFDDKGYMTAPEFRRFCSPVVPLAKISKFTWQNNEEFRADLELNQFADQSLKDVAVTVIIKGTHDEFLRTTSSYDEIPIGQNFPLGNVSFNMGMIKIPTKMTLEVKVEAKDKNGMMHEEGFNDWNFWVYPRTESREPKAESRENGDVWVSDTYDEKVEKVLAEGGKVLLTAAGKITYGKEVVQQFTPVFWNTSWFKMRPPHTTGIYVDNTHSVFELFPTDDHSDLQWWELVNKAQVMQFTEFPADFQPLVQSIDTWFLSRKIGMLFEANVGGGKLMMTTMDITNHLDERIVARQMRISILHYMNSPKFNPKFTLDAHLIKDLYTKEAPKVNMFTKDSPDELKPKIK